MHSFKILPKDEKSTFDNKAYCFLNRNVGKVIAEEVDLLALGECFGGVNKQYLALNHFSLHPGAALKRIGCANTGSLLQVSAYQCGFMPSDTPRYSLVPLGIVVNEGIPGLHKYGEAFDTHAKSGISSSALHLLSDGERFLPEVLQNDLSDDGTPHHRPDRFEQLYMGSGYTREHLAEKRFGVSIQSIGLNLDNGDTLLAYAYRKEPQ